MPTLAIITVSWNTRDLLRRSIQTVHASLAGAGIDYTIVVVDNASSDGTPAMLRAEHPEVLLLEAGRNLGFAGGNNLALRKLLAISDWGLRVGSDPPISNPQSPIPDYVFLLNPDTEVVGDAIPALVRYRTHPDVAVVGSRCATPMAVCSRRAAAFPPKGFTSGKARRWSSAGRTTPGRSAIIWPTRPTTPSRRSTGWLARHCWLAALRSSAPACSIPDLRCIRRSWNGSGESGG
jgi:GT2 family glycosyltransferase